MLHIEFTTDLGAHEICSAISSPAAFALGT